MGRLGWAIAFPMGTPGTDAAAGRRLRTLVSWLDSADQQSPIRGNYRGGEGGIRTRETTMPPTRFPTVLLRPLGHLSGPTTGYAITSRCQGAACRSFGLTPPPAKVEWSHEGRREWFQRARGLFGGLRGGRRSRRLCFVRILPRSLR